jgi:hypothetical protein
MAIAAISCNMEHIPDKIIVDGITKVCNDGGFNVKNIYIGNHHNYLNPILYWTSTCGILGDLKFHIGLNLIKDNLESGLRHISTLIAFTNLLCLPENHQLASKIKEAHNECSSPYYFTLRYETNTIITYYPANNPLFITLKIKYDYSEETGEYEWNIPDIPEVIQSIAIRPDEMTGVGYDTYSNDLLTPPTIYRGVTEYRSVSNGQTPLSQNPYATLGLERRVSGGFSSTEASREVYRYIELNTPKKQTNEDSPSTEPSPPLP